MKARPFVMLALCALALAACARLSSCKRSGTIAQLVAFQGRAERVTGRGAWQSASPGDRFVVGDAVRTGAGSHARVEMTGGGALNLGANSLVRFVAGPMANAAHPTATSRIESGDAEIEAADDDLVLDTAHGMAHVGRGGRVHVEAVGGGEVRFEVSVGRVVIDQADGGSLTAGAGERLRVEVARAVIEPIGTMTGTMRPFVPVPIPSRPEPTPAGVIDAGAVDAAVDATADVASDGSGNADAGANVTVPTPRVSAPAAAQITVSAGDSPTIHHAHGNTTVRLRVEGACAPAMAVTFDGRALPSPDAAASLGAGRHRYQVRCAPGSHLRPILGSVQISRDAGTSPLPRHASRTTIDTDGRRYSVLYQNLLPEVTVRWPHPPPTGPYVLTVRSSTRRPRTTRSAAPTVTLSSGQLLDGSYTVWFTAGAQRSQETAIEIAFDNASHRAEIREPVDGASGGATVTVSGSALPGTIVAVDGAVLPLDGEHRFRGEAHPAHGVVVIRITQQGHAVHYYLRDVRGGPP